MIRDDEPSQKPEKGMSVEACIEKAAALIEKYGVCLFLFDVKGSRSFHDRYELQLRLESLAQGLNAEFDQYFPVNNLAVASRTEKGFACFLGDSSWAGINDAGVIPMIVDYSVSNYPDLAFYYSVAKDGYDKEGSRIIR